MRAEGAGWLGPAVRWGGWIVAALTACAWTDTPRWRWLWLLTGFLVACAVNTAATLRRLRSTHRFLAAEPSDRLVAYLRGEPPGPGYDPDRSSSFRLNAILQLQRRGDARVLEILVAMLSSRRYQERKFALYTLQELTDGDTGGGESFGDGGAAQAERYRRWWEGAAAGVRWDPDRRRFVG